MIIDDPMLLALIGATEDGIASGIPITVNVHGFMVTGFLCSREEYMVEAEAHAAGVAGFNSSDAIAALHRWVRDCEAADQDKAQQVEHRFDFIHLKNVQFLSSAFKFTREGLPWRAKTSAIDGWSLGVIDIR